MDEAQLRDKLRKIETLLCGATDYSEQIRRPRAGV